MNTKMRLTVLLLVFCPLVLGGLGVSFLSLINIVERDPNPFDGRKLTATYASDRGDLSLLSTTSEHIFEISGAINTGLKIKQDGTSSSASGAAGYTPFWIPFKNPMITLGRSNPDFPIFDTAGILGDPSKAYTARQENPLILWDEYLQSQASYRFGIFDENGARVATGIYDATCGLLFNIRIKHPDKPDMRLTRTNFNISRNRVSLGLLFVLIFGVVIGLCVRSAKGKTGEQRQQAVLMVRMVALGIVCLGVDTMIDLWYPFALGRIAPILLHLLLTVALYHVGRRACIPAAAEIVMALALWTFQMGPAPTLAFIPGLTVSFILAVGMIRKRVQTTPE